jgi:hypothetical protein
MKPKMRDGPHHAPAFANRRISICATGRGAGTAAAKAWVEATLPKLPERIARKDLRTTRNTSGVVGVRLANATRSRNGHEYPDWRWVAFWPGCAQTSGIGWSVKKYGDSRAFVSACIGGGWSRSTAGRSTPR